MTVFRQLREIVPQRHLGEFLVDSDGRFLFRSQLVLKELQGVLQMFGRLGGLPQPVIPVADCEHAMEQTGIGWGEALSGMVPVVLVKLQGLFNFPDRIADLSQGPEGVESRGVCVSE